MKIVHLYTGADGQSHFEDIELNLRPMGFGMGIELVSEVQGLALRELEPGFQLGYHTAPRRQIVLQLSGMGELTCGDGTSRTFGPGDILLADDLTGQGHMSREVAGPRRQAFIYLDPNLDLRALRADG